MGVVHFFYIVYFQRLFLLICLLILIYYLLLKLSGLEDQHGQIGFTRLNFEVIFKVKFLLSKIKM